MSPTSATGQRSLLVCIYTFESRLTGDGHFCWSLEMCVVTENRSQKFGSCRLSTKVRVPPVHRTRHPLLSTLEPNCHKKGKSCARLKTRYLIPGLYNAERLWRKENQSYWGAFWKRQVQMRDCKWYLNQTVWEPYLGSDQWKHEICLRNTTSGKLPWKALL